MQTSRSTGESEKLCLMIEELGGLEKIEALQSHQNEAVYKSSFQIIDRFFSEKVNGFSSCLHKYTRLGFFSGHLENFELWLKKSIKEYTYTRKNDWLKHLWTMYEVRGDLYSLMASSLTDNVFIFYFQNIWICLISCKV